MQLVYLVPESGIFIYQAVVHFPEPEIINDIALFLVDKAGDHVGRTDNVIAL